MLIGIPEEVAPSHTLVAATPDTAGKLIKLGYDVCLQAGAGLGSNYTDDQYEAAGVTIVDKAAAWGADIVLCCDLPTDAELDLMHEGAALACRMNPGAHGEFVADLAARKITGIAMDAIPRLSRAQSMDVRSSMMNIAGYRSVVEAAHHFGRTLGGQVTAAGKVQPARIYVIGVGVAGLAAIGQASSMGAIVSATDVRADVAEQVESLGASFVEIPVVQESKDGYAKALGEDEQDLVLQVYRKQAAINDIVITTAQVPGRPAPILLDDAAVAGMKPGSVVIDMGASPLGGNCTKSVPGETVVTENGVIIVDGSTLAEQMPGQASQLYGQNIVNFIKLCTPGKDGVLALDQEDAVVRGVTVSLDGDVTWPPPAISVSAAPAPKKEETAKAEEPQKKAELAPAAKVDAPAQAEKTTPAKTEKAEKTGFAKHWWKILAGALGVALILAAPSSMTAHFIVFELAVVVGFYVITNVTHSLHTPLMSVTNAISGIIIVGALLQVVNTDNMVVVVLSVIAMAIASINIFGGFLVTNRMLKMFERSSED